MEILLFSIYFIIFILHCLASDLSINSYTSINNQEVTLSQVLYASKSIDKDIPVITWVDNVKNLIISLSILPSKDNENSHLLIEENNLDKYIEEANMLITARGYYPDITSSISYINTITHSHHFTFDEYPNIDYYTKKIALWLTRGLYAKVKTNDDEEEDYLSRPMACSFSFATYDKHKNKCRLIRVENSGRVQERKVVTFGRYFNRNLIKNIEELVSNHSQNNDVEINCDFNEQLIKLLEEKLTMLADGKICFNCNIISQKGFKNKNNINYEEVLQFIENYE